MPRNCWMLQVGNHLSLPIAYDERFIGRINDELYAAQTNYYGEECVWKIGESIPHESVDNSLPTSP
jgi:hypothetical protein